MSAQDILAVIVPLLSTEQLEAIAGMQVTAPAPASTPSAPEPNGSPFGIYAEYLRDSDLFTALHPIVRKGAKGKAGSTEIRAKLNTLPITGKCSLSAQAYKVLPTLMTRNGLEVVKTNKRNGKTTSRLYGVRTAQHGGPDGRATSLLQSGIRVQVTPSTRSVQLVTPKGKAVKFDATDIGAIAEALEEMSL